MGSVISSLEIQTVETRKPVKDEDVRFDVCRDSAGVKFSSAGIGRMMKTICAKARCWSRRR